jgi:threonine synthase
MNPGGFHKNVSRLVCDSCGASFRPGEIELTCPSCGDRLGTLTVEYDLEAISRLLNREVLRERRDFSHWRYLELLPVAGRPAELHPRVGWTPLYETPDLARRLGLERLWLKDDGLNPSASYKDRASSVAVAHALSLGRRQICAASTGNAASSLSLFAACAGLRAVILVPESAPEAKLAQLLLFGAEVLMVRGNYDQAFELSLGLSRQLGFYCRSTAVNPVLAEGKKTGALEICEQFDFEPPDWVAVGVGDGCILGGLWKGFCDFYRLGLIHRRPRLLGVQAAGSAPLYRAWREGAARVEDLQAPSTAADSICVGRPRDQLKALRAVRESGGAFMAVDDEEILGAMRLMGSAGVFAEPAGAASLAGLAAARGQNIIGRSESALALITGNGLKDISSARRAAAARPRLIDADLAAALEALQRKE